MRPIASCCPPPPVTHAPSSALLTHNGTGPMQQQQQYSQPMQSPAHQFAQNRQTASPSTNGPSFSQPQQSPSMTLASNGQMPNQQTPMAQPTRPDTAQAQTPVKAVPPSPVSPVNPARQQERVTTLLEINSLLIREVCELQTQGKAGQVGQTADGKTEGDKQQPSKEYVEYVYFSRVLLCIH